MTGDPLILSRQDATLYLHSALEVSSCLIFVGSIHLLLVPEKRPSFFTFLVYLSVIAAEFLRPLKRFPRLQFNSRLPLGIWLSPAFHNILIALIFLLLRVSFSGYFVAQLFCTVLPVVQLVKTEIGGRIESSREPLIRLFDYLRTDFDLKQAAARSEIFLTLQIVVLGSLKGCWRSGVAFILYFVFHTLYNMSTNENHHRVYAQFGEVLERLAPDSSTLRRKAASRLMGWIWKLKAAAQKLYPIPVSEDK
jgi:hypothetical protein